MNWGLFFSSRSYNRIWTQVLPLRTQLQCHLSYGLYLVWKKMILYIISPQEKWFIKNINGLLKTKKLNWQYLNIKTKAIQIQNVGKVHLQKNINKLASNYSLPTCLSLCLYLVLFQNTHKWTWEIHDASTESPWHIQHVLGQYWYQMHWFSFNQGWKCQPCR